MASKDDLHHLVDRLPDHEVHAAQRFLQYLCDLTDDPILRLLKEAPEDDEPATSQEDKAAEEAWQEHQRGQSRPWEQVRKELAGE